MRYKKIPNTDMNISSITVGTWAIGADGWGDVNTKDSIEAIHAMVDNGVNFIDTAPIYGFGHSEEVVGQAIKGLRDKVLIATKFGSTWPNGVNAPSARNNGRENIMKEVDDSLRRLGIDCIDLYIAHWPDFEHFIEEMMGALTDLQKAGKIRYIGLSNHDEAMMEEANKYGQVAMAQLPYSMVNRTAEETMQWVVDHGMATMTYGSLGAGILTGTIREIPKFDEKDRRATFYHDYFSEPMFSRTMKLLETLDDIAAAHGNVPVAQVAVNWSTQHPLVSTAIMGVRNVAEANENCAAMSWSLSDEEFARINKAIEETVGQGAHVKRQSKK